MNEYQEKEKANTRQVLGEVSRQGSDQRRRVRRTVQTAHSQNRTFQSRDLAHQPQGTYRAEYIPKNRKNTNSKSNRRVKTQNSKFKPESLNLIFTAKITYLKSPQTDKTRLFSYPTYTDCKKYPLSL